MRKKEDFVSPRVRGDTKKQSLQEAGTSGASTSIGELYAVPFAKEIGAQPIQVGFLTALSGIIAPLVQLFGTHLLERGKNRKQIVLTFVFFQSIMWLPIIALAIAIQTGHLAQASTSLFILLYTLLVALGNVTFPAWFSWIGDLIPEHERGKYFSVRNRIIGVVGLVVVLGGAFIIDLFRTRGYILLGFALIFACAATCRLGSLLALKRIDDPPFKSRSRDHFSFISFLKRMDNFGKFSLYLAAFNAALMFASPFFALYMLEELKFSYVTLMLVTLSSTLVYLLVIPLMGKFSDRYGNKRLLHIANIAFIFSPLPWIIVRDPLLLIIIPQLFAGVANAALVIGATNFTYDAVSPRHRPLCVTYSNILVGGGTFIGAMLGGLVLKYHPTASTSYLYLFGMASLFRFLVAFIGLPKIKEVKPVEQMPSLPLDITHPVKTIQQDVTWMRRMLSS